MSADDASRPLGPLRRMRQAHGLLGRRLLSVGGAHAVDDALARGRAVGASLLGTAGVSDRIARLDGGCAGVAGLGAAVGALAGAVAGRGGERNEGEAGSGL